MIEYVGWLEVVWLNNNNFDIASVGSTGGSSSSSKKEKEEGEESI